MNADQDKLKKNISQNEQTDDGNKNGDKNFIQSELLLSFNKELSTKKLEDTDKRIERTQDKEILKYRNEYEEKREFVNNCLSFQTQKDGEKEEKKEKKEKKNGNVREREKTKIENVENEIEGKRVHINTKINENMRKKAPKEMDSKTRKEVMLQQSKRLKCTFCLLGCLTICGLRNTIVRKLAFSPPEIRGYTICDNQFICNNSRRIEFDEMIKRHNLNVNFFIIKKGLYKIATLLIYKEPLNLEKQIILFSNGNSTDIGHMSIFFLNLVLYSNINLIAYDYSGYGYSNKKPSEKNLYRNINIVYNYVINKLKVAPNKIIIYGHSIGSVCNCYLMSLKHVKIGGCILHSPLASGLRLLLHFENAKIPWFDVFKNVERLRKISPIPIFLMHGKKDKQVPYSHSVYIKNVLIETYEKKIQKQKAKNSKTAKDKSENSSYDSDFNYNSLINFWGIENADHNDIVEKNTILFYQKIKDFLLFCEGYNQNRTD